MQYQKLNKKKLIGIINITIQYDHTYKLAEDISSNIYLKLHLLLIKSIQSQNINYFRYFNFLNKSTLL